MVKIPVQVMEKFNHPDAVKFLATVDKKGTPNVVYVKSLIAWDEQTLIYADVMGVKTKQNLQDTGKVAVSVLIPDKLISYQVKGEFIEFQKSGPYYEKLSSFPGFKYNAYFGVRAVGVIEVKEVYSACLPLPGRRIVPPEPYTEESSTKLG